MMRWLAFVAILVAMLVASRVQASEPGLLGLINDYRVEYGAPELTVSPTLSIVALWTAYDMANNDYFAHIDSQGRDPFERMDAFGYTAETWKGENLAAGVAEESGAFDLWLNSPAHNANMLKSNYAVIGLAKAQNAESTYGTYWAAEFGGAEDTCERPLVCWLWRVLNHEVPLVSAGDR